MDSEDNKLQEELFKLNDLQDKRIDKIKAIKGFNDPNNQDKNLTEEEDKDVTVEPEFTALKDKGNKRITPQVLTSGRKMFEENNSQFKKSAQASVSNVNSEEIRRRKHQEKTADAHIHKVLGK